MFLQDLKRAARANIWPALALQCFSIFLFLAYFKWPAFHASLIVLAGAKRSGGLIFTFAASAFAGAVCPFCLQWLQRGTHRRMSFTAMLSLVVFYGFRGWIIDAFYTLQAAVWGDKGNLATVGIKIFCDLGIASPLFFIPSIVLMYSWIDSDFNGRRFLQQFTRGWYGRRVWPTLIMGWLVWLPALAMLYSLPASLQFVVVVLIQCLWALILLVVTDRDDAAHKSAIKPCPTPPALAETP